MNTIKHTNALQLIDFVTILTVYNTAGDCFGNSDCGTLEGMRLVPSPAIPYATTNATRVPGTPSLCVPFDDGYPYPFPQFYVPSKLASYVNS